MQKRSIDAKNRMKNYETIEELLAAPESEHYEFKEAVVNVLKIYR